MKFKAILFDLDGTLLDTLTDLANSMNAALAMFGFPPHPVDAFRYFVGDTMECETIRALPAGHRDSETVNKCLVAAKQHYSKCLADNTTPYPGIPELLSALEQRKLPKAVLSNKPDEFTRILVESILSRWTFRAVLGVGPSVPRKPDPAGALQIADRLQVAPQDVLYLGDTNTDMMTADAAGMYPVGALWGFRTAKELREAGARLLVKKPMQVLSLLDGSCAGPH